MPAAATASPPKSKAPKGGKKTSKTGAKAKPAAKAAAKKSGPFATWTIRAIKLVLLLGGVAGLAPLFAMLIYGLALGHPDGVLGSGVMPLEKADAIVVPGAALTYGGSDSRLSDALRWRMDTAIDLYKSGFAPFIIVSGGGSGRDNEADAMAAYAQTKGVPAAAILRERDSGTTRENAELTAQLMHRRGMKTAIAVSNWFHVPRVRMALKQAGIEAQGAVCRHPVWLRKEFYYTYREMAALWVYRLGLD
jgi:uncharacterized SAM-binding protein YcdF (DUF218 family)